MIFFNPNQLFLLKPNRIVRAALSQHKIAMAACTSAVALQYGAQYGIFFLFSLGVSYCVVLKCTCCTQMQRQ